MNKGTQRRKEDRALKECRECNNCLTLQEHLEHCIPLQAISKLKKDK